MYDLTGFKNKIIKYAIIAAGISELVSLPFIGLDVQFLYGLILGTAIAIVNFNVMEFTLKKTLEGSGGAIVFLGYAIRLILYGIAFYISIRISTQSGLGTALGFLTIKFAIFFLHGFKSKFSKGRVLREEPKELRPKKHWYDFQEDEDIID